MKKLKFYSGVAAAALSVLTPVCGYAVGVSDVMSLSQGELAFYIVLGGAALAMIGSICLLFALLFKGRSSKEDYDEYYDDEYYDEYEDDYEEDGSDEYEDDTYDAPDIDEADENDESNDLEETENSDYNENQEDENNEDTDKDSEENNLPEAENLQVEEAVSDIPKSVEDKGEASTDSKNDSDNSKSDVTANDASSDKVMITLSGVNSSDVKIVEFSDFATVGRRNTNSLMIADNAVSGVHCKFIYSDGEVILEDMNSTNGTVLNDEKITSAKVKTGDIVIIGKCKYKLNVSVSKN